MFIYCLEAKRTCLGFVFPPCIPYPLAQKDKPTKVSQDSLTSWAMRNRID